MADSQYQHYQQQPLEHHHMDPQQHYYQQQAQGMSQHQHIVPYGQPGGMPAQQMPPPMSNGAPTQQHQMVPSGMPSQPIPDPSQGDAAAGDDYANGNSIPMTQAQLASLLENIALLDTQRIILEPGVMIGETGQVLNLNLIRTKVNSHGYTLPDMLVDLNSICEPFLNQGPDHAAYATQFLDQANQSIVDAVRDAQFAASNGSIPAGQMDPGQGYGGPHQGQQQGYMMAPEGAYADGSQMMPPMDQGRAQPGGWMAEVVGDDGQGVMGDPNAPYMNGRGPPNGMHAYQGGPGMHGMGSPPESNKKNKLKRGPDGVLSPEKEKRQNVGSAPRPRLEGRRCQVCAVIKKAGCGTDNAHFRCLKKKKPDIAIELEKRVGELKDVGEEERVTVWNPKEGRKLSGQAAPMLKNLAGWLASHPGWEAHPRVTSTGSKPRGEGEQPSPPLGSMTPQPQAQHLQHHVQPSPMMPPQQLHQQFQGQEVSPQQHMQALPGPGDPQSMTSQGAAVQYQPQAGQLQQQPMAQQDHPPQQHMQMQKAEPQGLQGVSPQQQQPPPPQQHQLTTVSPPQQQQLQQVPPQAPQPSQQLEPMQHPQQPMQQQPSMQPVMMPEPAQPYPQWEQPPVPAPTS